MEHQHQHQHPAHAGQEHNEEWSSNLCNCAPCGTCLLSTFLPCVLLGRTVSRMRDPSMRSHDEMNSECLIFTGIQCFTGCGWIYGMMKRGEVRDQYGIKGSDCNDCCVSYWCLCCAMIQMDNEVKKRTQGLVTQGYQSEKQGMVMPSPSHQQPMPQHPPQAQGHAPYQSPK
ncbi:hypothetical protein HIM_09085 [Hirsutella minnesotensis 3608]|uniref:Protein PLANT CADMIUM RESISTANCE 3 n=1 Tax=Hirsutella minnesotensis 3608 TaxID=1043627 RepID=A0A0F7ZXY8_9HYPO|nr:hypothetical protein HIM_09085 [Hirsutella minnesotensis 3608]